MNDNENAILLGLILGDGTLDDKGCLGIVHSIKQKEYCEFKAKLLEETLNCNTINVHLQPTTYIYKNKNVTEKRYVDTIRFTKSNKDKFQPIHNLLYPNGKKYFSKDVLEQLNMISLAIW